MKHIPTPRTGLEEMTDRALLKVLEECNGEDSPIFIECLRRLMENMVFIKADRLVPLKELDANSSKPNTAMINERLDSLSWSLKSTTNPGWGMRYEPKDPNEALKKEALKRATMPEDVCKWENEKGERGD